MEKKYLKYREKYLNLKKQIGSAIVPNKNVTITSNEWLYKPIIYRPFTDINVHFAEGFNKKIKEINPSLPDLDSINKILLRFYLDKDIDLSKRNNLRVHYEFSANEITLNGQIALLEECFLIEIINDLALIFIQHMPINSYITFNHNNIYFINENITDTTNILPSKMKIECNQDNFRLENKAGLRFFKIDKSNNKINYNCSNTAIQYGRPEVITTEETKFVCDDGKNKYISHIEVIDSEDGKKTYKYNCSDFGPSKKINKIVEGEFKNSDNINIQCPDSLMLKSLELDKEASGKIRYKYKCDSIWPKFRVKEFDRGDEVPKTINGVHANGDKYCSNPLKNEGFEIVFRPPIDEEWNDSMLVLFEGRTCTMESLNRANEFKGYMIYCCDISHYWYVHNINKYINYIDNKKREHNIRKIILYGGSMGGYAVLYASCFIDNAIVISFNPQTLILNNKGMRDNNILNEKITWPGSINPFETDSISDLREMLIKFNNNSKKFIFVARSECDAFYKKESKLAYFADAINVGYLYNIPNSSIIIVNKNIHHFFACLKYKDLFNILYFQFDAILSNLLHGVELLKTDDLWYPDRK